MFTFMHKGKLIITLMRTLNALASGLYNLDSRVYLCISNLNWSVKFHDVQRHKHILEKKMCLV